MSIRACIFGCAGPELTPIERDFFAEAQPWAFIVFKRNVESPAQLAKLCASLRESVGRDAPVWVDQEGGRVQRLGPPHWRKIPATAIFGALFERSADAALEAVRLNHRLMAHELRAAGLDADCAPNADLSVNGANQVVIGDRAFSAAPESAAAFARAAMTGLHGGGVISAIKHLPGHGRARVDSHYDLPVVEADAEALETDIAAFVPVADAPCAITAHIVYPAWDGDNPATMSRAVVEKIIRGRIGFDGLLLTDDMSMKALQGAMGARVERAIAAGCDIAFHCNADPEEMKAVAEAAPVLDGVSLARAERAEAVRAQVDSFDAHAAKARLDELLAPVMGGVSS